MHEVRPLRRRYYRGVFGEECSTTKDGRLARAPRQLPAVPGVYVLRIGKRTYSGASTRVNARVIDHLRSLALGEHEHVVLQSLYRSAGGHLSTTVKLMPGATAADLALAERRVIAHLLRCGYDPVNQQLRPMPLDFEPGAVDGKRREAAALNRASWKRRD
jgi:hypothetical protein